MDDIQLLLSKWKEILNKIENNNGIVYQIDIGDKATLHEIKQNFILLIWGIPILFTIIFIPYQVWVLTGMLNRWGGVYIIGGTFLLTLTIMYIFYYKRKGKLHLQKSR